MQIVYAKKEFYKKPFIKDMMDAWTKQKHYPVLKVKNEIPFLKIEIENYNNLDLKYDWWIPITITKKTEPHFTISKDWNAPDNQWIKVSQSHYFNQSFIFPVQEDEWYIINLQQIGKYIDC